mmetsp:Transcript_13237/g.49094  ORF Transcript_13237/g.49094 Transcript_13237/m.49094 type:complete len:300 (+) Transcript_13237:232-1131(+)
MCSSPTSCDCCGSTWLIGVPTDPIERGVVCVEGGSFQTRPTSRSKSSTSARFASIASRGMLSRKLELSKLSTLSRICKVPSESPPVLRFRKCFLASMTDFATQARNRHWMRSAAASRAFFLSLCCTRKRITSSSVSRPPKESEKLPKESSTVSLSTGAAVSPSAPPIHSSTCLSTTSASILARLPCSSRVSPVPVVESLLLSSSGRVSCGAAYLAPVMLCSAEALEVTDAESPFARPVPSRITRFSDKLWIASSSVFLSTSSSRSRLLSFLFWATRCRRFSSCFISSRRLSICSFSDSF